MCDRKGCGMNTEIQMYNSTQSLSHFHHHMLLASPGVSRRLGHGEETLPATLTSTTSLFRRRWFHRHFGLASTSFLFTLLNLDFFILARIFILGLLSPKLMVRVQQFRMSKAFEAEVEILETRLLYTSPVDSS